MNKRKIGVIFDGGGFLGAYGVGFAKAMNKKGLKPMYVQGVSVGALNASAFVEDGGEIDRLESIWQNTIETNQKGSSFIFDFSTKSSLKRARKSGISSNAGVRYLCRNIDFSKILDSKIQLDVVVSDEKTQQNIIFSNKDEIVKNNPEFLRKATTASTAIPGIFPPVRINNCYYSDGFIFSIKPAFDAGCKTVFLFLNTPAKIESPWEKIWWKRVFIGYQRVIYLLKKQKTAEGKMLFKRKLVIFKVKEPVPGLSSLHFEKTNSESSQGSISMAIDAAYQEGLNVLNGI